MHEIPKYVDKSTDRKFTVLYAAFGQADASATSDGADIYELVKGIVNGFDTSRRLFPSLLKSAYI